MRNKLTATQTEEILRRTALGESSSALGNYYGVSRQTINKLVKRHSRNPISKNSGTSNGGSKLTYDLVDCIRNFLSKGASEESLALVYGVSRQTINNIKLNKTWCLPSIKSLDTVADYLKQLNLMAFRPLPNSKHERDLLDLTFSYYRSTGYPYRPKDGTLLAAALDRLKVMTSCLDNKTLRPSYTALRALNGFHPHIDHVPCKNLISPFDVFSDDALFRNVILKNIRIGSSMSGAAIRLMLAGTGKAQAVTNFRPTAAKAIYELFKPNLILDPCMGWGGRMFGALSLDINYIGIDPSSHAISGNINIVDTLKTKINSKLTLIQDCAENIIGHRLFRPDLIFTSPPYFDIEHYTNEPTQSYIRYPTFPEWVRGFLFKLIAGSFKDLRLDGYLILVTNHRLIPLVKDYGIAKGFNLKTIMNYEIPVSRERQRLHGKSTRYEPIIVMKKEKELK